MKRALRHAMAGAGFWMLASADGVRAQTGLGPVPARPAAVGAGAGGWRFAPGVALAYDSFGQRYSVTDDDTLDLYDEASTRLYARLEHVGRTRFDVQNMLGIGQEALRNDVIARLARDVGGGLDLRVQQELRYKGYTSASNFTSASDYLVGTTRATAAWRSRGPWRFRLDDRFEWAEFEPADRYNYRYRLHDLGGELERVYGLLSGVRAGYTYGTRSVPDSTVIDYRRHVGIAEWRHEGARYGFGAEQRLERRRYRDVTVRSHFWELEAVTDARIEVGSGVRLRPEWRSRWVQFDQPDSLWSDSSEHVLQFLFEGDAGSRTVLAVGPRAEFRRTRGAIDRPYDQWGLAGSVTFTLGSTLWLQFTDEVGNRRHAGGDDLLYTDFVFNWSTLYLSWQPLPRLGVDLFCAVNPELHDDKMDDTTTLLLSASVTLGWR